MSNSTQNLQVQKLVAAVSIVLFIIKLIAWWMTGSVAILTDALESIVNVVAGLVGVYSLAVSAKPKDIDHPYGHGKVEFISAAIEGTLITIAGFFIIYEAIVNLLRPHSIRDLNWGILLLAFTGVINYLAGIYCIRTGKKNNSLALIASGRHLTSDTYTTIGIVIGLILLYFTNILWIDSAVAILFALIIIFTGYKILNSSVAGIMDKADEKLLEKLIALLNTHRSPNWVDLHNLRIIKFGPTLHMDCHLTVPWYFNVKEAHQEVDILSELVRKEFGHSVELFVHSDACLESSCPICIKSDCTVRQHAFVERKEWTMENILRNKKHTVQS
jgi:cation diffusion facilitator family transporter